MIPSLEPRKALLVDYGGVLTGSLGHVFRTAEADAGLPSGALVKVLLDAYAEPDGQGFVHQFERGEITSSAFEQAMREGLRERGHEVGDVPVLPRVFRGLGPDLNNGVWSLVHRAREQGVATGLLSNSWGTEGYPIKELNAVFDDLVISGEVGLRKPDPAIYHLAAERLGVTPSQCIFVDDYPGNVEAAVDLGMAGVVHTGDAEATAAALEAFLGVTLR